MTQTRKSKTTLVAILLLITVLFCAMAMPASARTVVYPAIVTGQETGFWLYPGEIAEIHYFPNEQGNKMFTAWHTNLWMWDQAAAMTFYWKDTANPNDQWHEWRDAAVGCYCPKTTQNLYSGSNTIGYKFAFQQWTRHMLPICIKVT